MSLGSFLCGVGSGVSGYLWRQGSLAKGNVEEGKLLLEMEEGLCRFASVSLRSDPAGTIRVLAEPIIASEHIKMRAPDQPPGAAAGDPEKYMPRQEFLLRDQYLDKQGLCITTIGMTVYDILSKAEPKEGVASILDVKTASDIGLIADKSTVISAIDRTKTKMGSAYLHLSLSRPSASIGINLIFPYEVLYENFA